MALPAPGAVVGNQDAQACRPADSVAPVHILRAKAACQQVGGGNAGQPQAHQRSHGRHGGLPRPPQQPDIHILQGRDDVQRDHPHQICVARLHHRRGVCEQPHQLAAQGDHCRAEHGAHGRRHQQNGAHALLHPVHPARADVLSHIGGDRGGQALYWHEHEAVHLYRRVVSRHEHGPAAVDERRHDHDPHGVEGVLNAGGHADAQDVPENFPVKGDFPHLKAVIRELVVDKPHAQHPAEQLGEDRRQADAHHAQGDGDHQQVVQDHMEDAGQGQNDQR